MPRDYAALSAALRQLDTLPPGPAHDRALADLRDALRALPAADVHRLYAEIQRAALTRQASEHAPADAGQAPGAPPDGPPGSARVAD